MFIRAGLKVLLMGSSHCFAVRWWLFSEQHATEIRRSVTSHDTRHLEALTPGAQAQSCDPHAHEEGFFVSHGITHTLLRFLAASREASLARGSVYSYLLTQI